MADKYQEDNEKQKDTGVTDIANPINAFLMIKRKISDWKNIEKQMKTNEARELLDQLNLANYEGLKYPTEEDLTGAANGLLRLQDTYRLDPRDLAEGRIYKQQGNYTFDCEFYHFFEPETGKVERMDI